MQRWEGLSECADEKGPSPGEVCKGGQASWPIQMRQWVRPGSQSAYVDLSLAGNCWVVDWSYLIIEAGGWRNFEYADEVGALLSPTPQRDVCEVRWG